MSLLLLFALPGTRSGLLFWSQSLQMTGKVVSLGAQLKNHQSPFLLLKCSVETQSSRKGVAGSFLLGPGQGHTQKASRSRDTFRGGALGFTVVDGTHNKPEGQPPGQAQNRVRTHLGRVSDSQPLSPASGLCEQERRRGQGSTRTGVWMTGPPSGAFLILAWGHLLSRPYLTCWGT